MKRNTPDDYVRDAYALVEMGSAMVDAETVRMILVRLEDAGVTPPSNFTSAKNMRTANTEFAHKRGQPVDDGMPHYNGSNTPCDAWYSGGYCSCGAAHGWHDYLKKWV